MLLMSGCVHQNTRACHRAAAGLRNQPSQVLAVDTSRRWDGRDNRVASLVVVGRESIVRRAQDRSGSTLRLKDL